MKVDQIVWQVEVYQHPERFMLHKGVVTEFRHLDIWSLRVQPLSRYCPTTTAIKRLSCCQSEPLHRWFETKDKAIMTAKATCRSETLRRQTTLDDELADRLTLLNDLQLNRV